MSVGCRNKQIKFIYRKPKSSLLSSEVKWNWETKKRGDLEFDNQILEMLGRERKLHTSLYKLATVVCSSVIAATTNSKQDSLQ